MEPYQYWTIAGFLLLLVELYNQKSIALIFAGGALFAAVAAFKAPEIIWVQTVVFLVFTSLLYAALKPYVSKTRQGKNEHK